MTSELLSKNPEYYTVWNYRRSILQHQCSHIMSSASEQPTTDQIAGIIKNDLQFLLPLLRDFPKCYWIWNYRLWLLEEAGRLLPASVAYKFWQEELALVSKVLSLDSRNFHGWGYRRTVVDALETFASQGPGSLSAADKSMTQKEVDYTTKMIGINLSNFSAWHYRIKLIQKLLCERDATDEERKKMLENGKNGTLT
jgi:geranylgeranyl transferase type-2 subunit alpha